MASRNVRVSPCSTIPVAPFTMTSSSRPWNRGAYGVPKRRSEWKKSESPGIHSWDSHETLQIIFLSWDYEEEKHLPTGARLLPFTVVSCLAKLGNHGWGSNMFDQLGTCTQCGPPTIQWTRNLPMISGLVKHGNGQILIYRCLSHVHACTWSFTGDFSLPWLITKGYSTYIYIYTYIQNTV